MLSRLLLLLAGLAMALGGLWMLEGDSGREFVAMIAVVTRERCASGRYNGPGFYPSRRRPEALEGKRNRRGEKFQLCARKEDAPRGRVFCSVRPS
jgi:hypothetical protein